MNDKADILIKNIELCKQMYGKNLPESSYESNMRFAIEEYRRGKKEYLIIGNNTIIKKKPEFDYIQETLEWNLYHLVGEMILAQQTLI